MEHKIIKLSADDLDNGIKERLSFWADPSLLAVYAKRDSLNFYYLCATKNDTISAVIPVFEKKKYGLKYITQLNLCIYTPIVFFLNEDFEPYHTQNEQLLIMKAIGKYLKKNYIKITLSFDYEITDMRAFKWTGFSVEPMYTYKKKIDEYNKNLLPRDAKIKLKKAIKSDLYINECWDINIISLLMNDMCNRKNISKYLLQKEYLVFLDALYQHKICSMVVVYKDKDPVAFWSFLKDSSKNILYGLVSAGNKLGNDLGAHALCVDYIMNNYSDFDTYDFCSANVESVAYFKSQFNCDLVNYYRISKKYLS